MQKLNITLNTPLRILFPKLGKLLGYARKTSEIIFTAIVFVLIPVIAFTLITSRTSALLGFQSFTVLSGSMSPAIPTGSIVYTQKAEKIGIGDVITFKKKDVNVTHRVIAITDKEGKPVSGLVSPLPGAPAPKEIFYRTKGDANNSEDSDLVSASSVIGKTFVNVPAVGRLTGFLKTIPGFLIFIIGPTLIFIGFELWNIKKEIEKQTEKKVLDRLRIV